ncbi:hypothetical protein [Streptomyces sp. EN23]|uniref:hypothetical protein n=1 Tax=Streptomyces sp. EN23 TaxID=212774 RepID=UPI00114CB604|nr:hypothetical protein [Streptomyces sp. EN23]
MTMTPAEAPSPEVQIVQVDATGTALLAVVVRCLATTRLGARFRCTSPNGQAVDLVLAEMLRYPQVPVDEVDPPHGARLVLTGAGSDDLHFKSGDVLRGTNPTP